jgi:hypothetical protein
MLSDGSHGGVDPAPCVGDVVVQDVARVDS